MTHKVDWALKTNYLLTANNSTFQIKSAFAVHSTFFFPILFKHKSMLCRSNSKRRVGFLLVIYWPLCHPDKRRSLRVRHKDSISPSKDWGLISKITVTQGPVVPETSESPPYRLSDATMEPLLRLARWSDVVTSPTSELCFLVLSDLTTFASNQVLLRARLHDSL